jgi:endonuclease/exonuclease/phosphatase family metal-dependent hydrolase
MKKLIFIFWASLTLSACSLTDCDGGAFCSGSATETARATAGAQSFSIANWNVQTFFDGVTEGTEYSDFKSAAKWSNSKYYTRLKRLCEVLLSLNADIFVLEEIENEGVLNDIANQFAGNSWDAGKLWPYCCFSKEKKSAIGCAVLSRFPLYGIKTHSLDIRTQKEGQPSMRPILEVSAAIYGRDVRLFVNHWKSKSGGEEESEIWRDWQEALLAQRLAKLAEEGPAPCIICGDFNRDAKEFCLVEGGAAGAGGATYGGNVVLRGAGGIRIYSPWFSKSGSFSNEIGSYYYKGSWERIDHIFCYGKVRISGFSPRASTPWANEDKTPNAYKIYSGSGYSDHLPVMANIVLE